MYARLWWKDARQFWPIWVFLALAAAVVQGVLLHYAGPDARQGMLGLSALICASLYAFAIGAAAFAGEREVGTLRLLDILPVDRRVVWTSKVSFALVTTLALTLVLLAMAAMSSDRWKSQGLLSVLEAMSLGMMVLVALASGLFWSAILDSALTAAVTAICCTGLGLMLLLRKLDEAFVGEDALRIFVLSQLLVILAMMIGSKLIFARAIRLKTAQLEFRSPIVLTRADVTGPRRLQLQVQSPVATVLVPVPRPISAMRDAPATDQPPRRSRVVEARALAWQTLKEGWRSWCLLAVIGLVIPGLLWGNLDPVVLWLIIIGVGLVAGANVFGLENRKHTYRLLSHHGARPRLVWLVKLVVWSAGLALIWVPQAIVAESIREHVGGSLEKWLLGLLTPLLFFAVAQLSGMVIRRGITAVVVALVIGLALAVPQIALVIGQMLPVEGLLVLPAALLLVTWAWSGDWLLDRPAPGRWLRLGLLLTSTFTLAVGWYAGYRAWSIPDVGPIAPPAAWVEAAARPLSAEQNAAELYREAGRRLVGSMDSPEFPNRNRQVLDLVRRAAARSDCRFQQPEKLTLIDHPDLPPMGDLARLVILDAQDRREHGDLAGAWDDIVVLFRMARHCSEGGFSMVSVQRNALGLALEWAVARGQTIDRLHAALSAYGDLPKMPSAADIVRAEANLVERTLDLPTSTLRDWLYYESTIGMNGPRSERKWAFALVDVVTTPWERARARRVNRLLSLAAIQNSAHEPWQRPGYADSEVSHAQRTTPLAMTFIRNPRWYIAHDDLNEVERRALVQILALRAWQLRHGGELPDRLDSLVPEELPTLPDDPYSGRSFGYVRSNAQVVAPLSSALFAEARKVQAAANGSWLLYSVGTDGRDDGGTTFKDSDRRNQPMDIVFAIPPMEGDAGATKTQDRGQGGAKDRPAPAGRPAPPGSGL